MDKLLENLYEGNVSPVDFRHTETEEDQQKRKQYEREYEAFWKTMRDLELQNSFEALLSQYDRLSFHDSCEAFQDGFCLGVRLMQEVALRFSRT